jgi:hypothetical protein
MNKIAVLTSYYQLLTKLLRFFPSEYVSMQVADSVLLSDYGMDCHVGTLHYHITDDSKFALFMLKYPEHIENIVYE